MNFIMLDLSYGICNAKCNWCHVPYFKDNIKLNKFMSLEDVYKFIELNKNNKNIGIIISGFGEALLNPNFFKIISAIYNSGIHLRSFITNFSTNLSEDEIIFLSLVFDKINIEMGGLSKETRYNNMFIENDYFFNNLEKLLKIIQKNRTLEKSFYLKIIRNKINDYEIRNKDVSINAYVSMPMIYNDKFLDMVSKKNSQYFYDLNYMENVPIEIIKESNSKICTTKRLLRILPNGEITLCCAEPRNSNPLNDFNGFEQSIEDIVSSKKFLKLREDQNYKNYSIYCKYCHE